MKLSTAGSTDPRLHARQDNGSPSAIASRLPGSRQQSHHHPRAEIDPTIPCGQLVQTRSRRILVGLLTALLAAHPPASRLELRRSHRRWCRRSMKSTSGQWKSRQSPRALHLSAKSSTATAASADSISNGPGPPATWPERRQARSLKAKQPCIEKPVAEFAVRIHRPRQLSEVRQFFILRLQPSRRQSEKLSPMWAGRRTRQSFLHHPEQFPHHGPILLQREMNSHTVSACNKGSAKARRPQSPVFQKSSAPLCQLLPQTRHRAQAASTAFSRGTKILLCNSCPLLGV